MGKGLSKRESPALKLHVAPIPPHSFHLRASINSFEVDSPILHHNLECIIEAMFESMGCKSRYALSTFVNMCGWEIWCYVWQRAVHIRSSSCTSSSTSETLRYVRPLVKSIVGGSRHLRVGGCSA